MISEGVGLVQHPEMLCVNKGRRAVRKRGRSQRMALSHQHIRGNQKPRILICDGFGTHESLEVMQYCFENHIILCRIPSHTSHKLQPCDVGVFGPLKAAYREQVERLYRQSASSILHLSIAVRAGVKRMMVTAIECISADGRSLLPLIIWPATTHRSTWTTHHRISNPGGQRQVCIRSPQTGYSEISRNH
jgi:DDE superfamily endonuclease